MDILDKLPKNKGLDGSELYEGSPPVISRPRPKSTGPGAGKLSTGADEQAEESHDVTKPSAPSDADKVKPPPPPSPSPAREAHKPGERSDTAPSKKQRTMTGDAEEHEGGERKAEKAMALEAEQIDQQQKLDEMEEVEDDVEKKGKEDVEPASDTKVVGIL